MAILADVYSSPRPDAYLRALFRDATASQIGFGTAAVLFSGLLLSIFTTADPLWWHLHFSRLGTFADFSGFTFNVTILLTSAGVVLFALRLRTEMRRHAGTAVLQSRRAATVVPVLIASIGIHLSVVGFVPVNLNEFVHDRGSTGAVFSFIAILSCSRWMLRGMHRSMTVATRFVAVGLVLTVAPYIAGFINLAAFELIVFSLVFFWLLRFAGTVGRPADEPAQDAPAVHATAEAAQAATAVRATVARAERATAALPRAEHVVAARRHLHAQLQAHSMQAAIRPSGIPPVHRHPSRNTFAQRQDAMRSRRTVLTRI